MRFHLHLHIPDFSSQPSKLGNDILISAEVGCESLTFSSQNRSLKISGEDASAAPTAGPSHGLQLRGHHQAGSAPRCWQGRGV